MNFSFHVEETPMDTGGALKSIYEKTKNMSNSNAYAVINGDNLLDIQLQHVFAYHNIVRAAVTMCIVEVPDVREYGSVICEYNTISRFVEKGSMGSGMINTGYYIMDNSVLESLPDNQKFSLETELFPQLAYDKEMAGYITSNAQWFDVGTYDRLQKAEEEWRSHG